MDPATLAALFGLAFSAASQGRAFSALGKKKGGDVNAMQEELTHNVDLCHLVVAGAMEPMTAIEDMSMDEFLRLNREGFNFNSLSGSAKTKIWLSDEQREKLRNLEFLHGRDTDYLVRNIYKALAAAKRRLRTRNASTRYRWSTRVINIYKRLLILEQHLRR